MTNLSQPQIDDLIAENNRLRAELVEIARREPEAREIVTQNRWPSTLAIDMAGRARQALMQRYQSFSNDAGTREEMLRTALTEARNANSMTEVVLIVDAVLQDRPSPVETKARHLQPRYVLEQIMNNSTDPWAKGVARTCLMESPVETKESPLGRAVRIARGDVGPPVEPMRFAENGSDNGGNK